MKKSEELYEGKAKKIFTTDEDPGLVIHYFKDDATAFDGKKKGQIKEKGKINAQMSAFLFGLLEEAGVKTHFKKLLSENELLTDRVEIIPVETIARNIAAGSLAKRIGYAEGKALKKPIIEFYYKDDDLGDPILNRAHIAELELASPELLDQMKAIALKVNEILKQFFADRGIDLVDFKLEFGLKDNELLLADEISPDTCRLWDSETQEKLDKDRFRRDLGKVEESYQEVLKRITQDQPSS